VIELLDDIQSRLTKDGDSTYYDVAFKIASSQGLDAAPLQVSWDPSLETLTIHRYRILRNGQSTDLLRDGSKLLVVQREQNMEDAALDGELTASMQPSDVRVGDIVEMTFTRTRRDPALGGRSEALVGPSDGDTYGRLRLRFLWPDDKKLQWRAFPGVLQPKLTHSAAGYELVSDLANVTTPLAPQGAPGRYSVVNAIDISEFADWAAVSAAMLPLYTDATNLSDKSPVRAEAQRIAAQTSDPARRAELALQLVQDQIRYLFIGMDDGGYVPAAADLTWSRRFGDCKAKAVLLVALLKELGIEAEPVLVNTDNGDLVAKRLPSLAAFNHVIVRATIGGRTYWLDGTRFGDSRLDRLDAPPYHFGLPVAAGVKALVPLQPAPLIQPSETVTLALDASAGIDAPAKANGEMRFRGPSGADMRMKYAGLSASDRDQQLRDLWRKNYDFVSPASVNSAVDERTGDFVITMTGRAKMDWLADVGTRWYELDRARLGWKFDTDRTAAIENDAPFAFDYPDYWESRETIKLPDSGEGWALQGGAIDQTVDGIYAFHRKVDLKDRLVTMEASTRALAAELPAGKAEEFRDELNALSNKGVYVRVPDDYMATAADIAALQGNKHALAAALLHRGAVHVDRREFAAGVTDENAALALEPDNATAQSVRALALAGQGDASADAAADKAIAIDPKQDLAWRAKGVIAFTQKRYADAESAYSHQLDIDPKDGIALGARASSRLMLGRYSDALSDVDAALAVSPTVYLRIVRAGALAGLDRKDDALAETDRAVAAAPENETIRKARAEVRLQFGERELAIEDYSALIKQSPKVDYYLARADLWPETDTAKRDADLNAALAIDPHSVKALALRAAYEIRGDNLPAAQKDVAALESADGGNALVYQLKLQLLSKQGKARESLQVADAYIAKHPNDAAALNERCWTKATLNVDLKTALSDCDASLKLAPNNAATLDSRAFTKLRLGETDQAIADYDAALKLVPTLPASLFGRAIARARKGDEAGAQSDAAEARALSPGIDARFASFGVIVPATIANGPSAPKKN
jgi:tetratricopeptide (TPR) repeat protein